MTPDLLVVRPYRARFREILPGDNAGQVVRYAPDWPEEQHHDQMVLLMSTPPEGRCDP